MSAGRPWLLLRGLTRESRHWGDFPRQLGETFPGAPVICLDLPGNGRLDGQPSPCSVDGMADFCHGESARLSQGQPCRVLAMSLGAMVAVSWSERYPGDIAAAVLINTSLRPFSPFYRRLRPTNYLRLARLFVTRPSDRALEEAVLRMTTLQVADPEAVLGHWLRLRRECPVSRQNALRQLLAAARYRAPATRPLERMLLLASERDALVHASCSRRLALQWGVPLEVHPTAGHDLPLDDPAWVLARVRRWQDTGAA